MRYLDIHEDDQLDEAQLGAWVKQASRTAREKAPDHGDEGQTMKKKKSGSKKTLPLG